MRTAEYTITFEPRGIAKLIREGTNRKEYRLKNQQGGVMQRLVLEVLGSRRCAWRVNYDLVTGTIRVRRKFKIGDHTTPLPIVTKRWRDALAKIEAGNDPAGDLAAERTLDSERSEMTFVKLATDYLASKAKPTGKKKEGLRWLPELTRLIECDLLPTLGKRPVAAITPLDVETVIETIVDRGALAQARTVHIVGKGIFNWGLGTARWRQAGLASNPASKIKGPPAPEPKTRKLSDDELRAFWNVLETGSGFEPGTADAFRLVLLLARRAREVLQAAWSEFELDRKDPLWRLPPSRSKNGREVLIPLEGLALDIAIRRRTVTATAAKPSAYVFPGTVGRPLSAGVLKTALGRMFADRFVDGEKLSPQLPPPTFSTHDLRRTVANRCSEELDYSQEVIAALLGHTAANVTDESYSQASKISRVRLLVKAWDAHLAAILAGKTVDRAGNVLLFRGSVAE